MAHRRTTLWFSGGILAATVLLFVIVPKGFIPNEDISHVTGTSEVAEGTSYDALVQHVKAAQTIVRQDPNVEAASHFHNSGVGTSHQ